MGKLLLTAFFISLFAAWAIYYSTAGQRKLFLKYAGKIGLVAIVGVGTASLLYALLTL